MEAIYEGKTGSVKEGTEHYNQKEGPFFTIAMKAICAEWFNIYLVINFHILSDIKIYIFCHHIKKKCIKG